MGDEADASDPTEVVTAEPTELSGVAEAGTESVEAWSLDDSWDGQYPTQRFTPRRITVAAIVASLAVIAGAGVVAVMHLRKDNPVPATAPATATAITTVVVAVPPPSAIEPPTPPPTHSQLPPAPVALPARGGSVWVSTKSGKTVCQITAGDVACNVQSTKPMPYVGGLPASGVSVAARGGWEWLVGDPGNPDYATLNYGTIYRALGWTITPTSEGTTFLNDATGHGMTVSIESFTPF
ncbi:MAG: hypothetical protein JST91_19975 [Actinobacteria bacterium]|nr:hypothetical protein [Actinomycetota bacterium]